MSKSMVRAQRAARRVPHGSEILELLSSPKSRKALVAAAIEGEPPVAAISKEFAALVGPKDLKLAQVKQYAGLCIRAILEEEGFEIERTGVWLGDDPVFSTGSVYRKVTSGPAGHRNELLERFVKVLTQEEARILQDLLSKRRKK
ncbi:MAG: hypothetical protein Q8M24_04815 [Pseudolabrys sp.]|nr:hypothetical protein [Pseudolabrys sp.]MDP2294768.1 hypothetical protein [Pseudolabrys sp.]